MWGAAVALVKGAFVGKSQWIRTGSLLLVLLLGLGYLYAKVRDNQQALAVQEAAWHLVLDELRYIRERVDDIADRD